MSDSRHVSKATLNVVNALRNPTPVEEEDGDSKQFPYAPRPVVDNVLKHEELTVAFHGMGLPNVAALKLMKKDVHGRPVPGSAVSVSMGCGQTGSRSKSVEAAIKASVPSSKWPYIGSFHRTNGSMVGVINMLQQCLANTNRASAGNLPSALRRSIASSVPYYPCRSLEEYPVDGMRQLGLTAMFTQGDETVKVNGKSDAGLFYRDHNKMAAPVKNELALRRAQGDLEFFLKNLVARSKDMDRALEAMALSDPLRFLVHAKPKMELCKVEEFGNKHRLINVFPLWEQLIAASVSLRTHKRVLNFIQDPASPFMHNAGWHDGNAARMIDRSIHLGEGLWMPNAGDDALGFAIQMVVRPMTRGEVRARARGEHALPVQLSAYRARQSVKAPKKPKRGPMRSKATPAPVVAVAAGTEEAKVLLDDALSKRVAESQVDAPVAAPPVEDDSHLLSEPLQYTYTLWDDTPVVLERPWATQVPAEVARIAAIMAPDIKRFDLSLLVDVWLQVIINCMTSLAVEPSRLMMFLISYHAYRYFHADVLFHRSEIMRARNIAKAGYHMTTPFNSQIVSCINLDHRREFHVVFSTRRHKTTGVAPNPPGAFNANVGRLYHTPVHPDSWFKEDYEVVPPATKLSQDTLHDWFAGRTKLWSGIGINYKPESLETKDYDLQAPKITLPFLNHLVLPWTFNVEGRELSSYIAVYAQPDKSLASLLNGGIRAPDEKVPAGAILMSQAVCIALGNCTNKEVYDVCRTVFERESEAGRTPSVDEQFLDGYAITDDIDIQELLMIPRGVIRPAFPTMERLQLFSLPGSYRKGLQPMYVSMSGVVSVPQAGSAPVADPNPFASLRDTWTVNSGPDDKAPVHVKMPMPVTDRAHAGKLVQTEEAKLKREALLAEHARKHREAQMRKDDANQRHYDQAAAEDAESTIETEYGFDDDAPVDDDDDRKSVAESVADPDIDDDAWARQQEMEEARYNDDAASDAGTHYTFNDRDADDDRDDKPRKMRGGGNEEDHIVNHAEDEEKVFDDPPEVRLTGPLAEYWRQLHADRVVPVEPLNPPVAEEPRYRYHNRATASWGPWTSEPPARATPARVFTGPDLEAFSSGAASASLIAAMVRSAANARRASDALDAALDTTSDAVSVHTADEEHEAYIASMYENCEAMDDDEMYGPPPEDYPEDDGETPYEYSDPEVDDEPPNVHVLLQFRGQTRPTTFEVDDDGATVRRAAAIYFPTEYVNIRLVHAGREIRDSDMLSEIGVGDGSRIEIMLRLLGGYDAPTTPLRVETKRRKRNTKKSGALNAPAAAVVRRAKSQSTTNMGRSSYNASTLNPVQDLRKGLREEIKEEVRKVGRSAGRAVSAARRTINESVRRNKPMRPKVRNAGRQYALTNPLRMGALGVPRKKVLKNGDEVFTCSQLVGGGEIYGATGTLVKVIDQPLNAGNTALWSKLADRAKGFEMFEIQSIVLHYKASCTQLSPGMMIGYVEKDPTDLAVSTVRDVIENGTSFSASVYEADWNKRIDVPKRKCYVHMGTSMVTDDAEKRQDNPGVLRVYLDQVDSTALRGYLYMTYIVKLMNRRESVPEAINASGDLIPYYGSFTTAEHANASAFYPLNVAAPLTNEGFGTYNWYLAGAADTQYPTKPHVSAATAVVQPRANAVYSTTDAIGVAPSIERCAAFSVPAGQYVFSVRGAMICGAAATGAGTGTLGVQYSTTDNINAGFSSWTSLGTGATAPSTNTTLPTASTGYSVSINGNPGRYVSFRLLWENSDGTVAVTALALYVRGIRNASSIDAPRPLGATRTFAYPAQQAALSLALLDFVGEVVLDSAASVLPPLSIEERLAALEADDARSCVAIPPPRPPSVLSGYTGAARK